VAVKSRLVFIDLLRGWAALVMIEVHVVNVFVLPEIKAARWFSVLNFINGLVAPSFLVVAGFVFVIASERKLDEFRTFGPAFWKQLGRIALIWCVGYLLHLPYFSFSRTVSATSEQGWLKFYQADILHCIAFGLLVLFLTRIVVKNERLWRTLLTGVAGASVMLAPFIWDTDMLTVLPAPIAAYINGQHYSQFPIFNWLGFLMCGGLTALAYSDARAAERERTFLRQAGWWGIGLILVGVILMELPVEVPLASKDIRANPLFFATRLGIVLLLMVLCWYYAERRKTQSSFVLDASRESLVVYTAHLLIIYGEFWNGHSLAFRFGKTFTLPETVAATLVLIAAMVLLAKFWGWLKQRSLPTARLVSYATGSLALILFFVRDS
jgi:uncharacterized membrane protein